MAVLTAVNMLLAAISIGVWAAIGGIPEDVEWASWAGMAAILWLGITARQLQQKVHKDHLQTTLRDQTLEFLRDFGSDIQQNFSTIWRWHELEIRGTDESAAHERNTDPILERLRQMNIGLSQSALRRDYSHLAYLIIIGDIDERLVLQREAARIVYIHEAIEERCLKTQPEKESMKQEISYFLALFSRAAKFMIENPHPALAAYTAAPPETE